MIKRRDDWAERLQTIILERNKRAFEAGRHDCCLTAADLIKTMTGTDLMKGFRGRYRSVPGAIRALRHIGKGTLLVTLISVAASHKMKQIKPPARAQMGDLVLIKGLPLDFSRGQAAGVCIGSDAIFPSDIGWARVPMSSVHRAWQVGAR